MFVLSPNILDFMRMEKNQSGTRRAVLFRGDLCWLREDPRTDPQALVYLRDGALAVCDGQVAETGLYADLLLRWPDAERVDRSGFVLMPGLIDAHVHFPQAAMPGMYGRQLMDWLREYTFPAESAYGDAAFARRMARFFLRELLRNGTTACLAYGSVHPVSAEALFEEASSLGMWLAAGKVWMDRNAPDAVLDTAEKAYEDSERLIRKWHGRGRCRYAVTPRFAVTSTPGQLEAAGALHRRYPDTYVQTHLSENRDEVELVGRLFPERKDYLEVYAHYGLCSPRTFFGHCVRLDRGALERLAAAGAKAVHCPTSNLFLGSGLYPLASAAEAGVETVLATDVAGGTSFSMWKTMGAAYQVQQLQGNAVSPAEWLYRCTLGAARALGEEDRLGSFRPGADADIVVMDPEASCLLSERKRFLERSLQDNPENLIFGWQILGDDRCVREVYLRGEPVLLH